MSLCLAAIELESYASAAAFCTIRSCWIDVPFIPQLSCVLLLLLLMSPVWTHVDNAIDRWLSFRPGQAQGKGDGHNKLGCRLDLHSWTFTNEDLLAWKYSAFLRVVEETIGRRCDCSGIISGRIGIHCWKWVLNLPSAAAATIWNTAEKRRRLFCGESNNWLLWWQTNLESGF